MPNELPFVSTWLDFVEQMGVNDTPRRGMGGVKHRCIQALVAKIAKEAGHRATIEFPILPVGAQHIDVAIWTGTVRIACEVPVSTRYREFPNIKKCLLAGYDYVVSVALDRRTLETVQRGVVERLTDEEREKVRFLFPEELALFLRQFEKYHKTPLPEPSPEPTRVGNRPPFRNRDGKLWQVTVRASDKPLIGEHPGKAITKIMVAWVAREIVKEEEKTPQGS